MNLFGIHKMIILSILMLFSTLVIGQEKSKKGNVLIVDGFSNHDWNQTSFLIKAILEKSGLFKANISTTPPKPGMKEWKTWRPKFKNYDVVIQNTNNIHNKNLRWPKKVEKDLEKYVKSGGGLYILHSANNAFADWPEYNLMIGLGWRSNEEGIALQVKDNGDIIRIPIGEGKATYHGPRNDEIINILVNHPINQGFPKTWKTPDMELYKYARGLAENLTVLSFAKDEKTNINWPVEWTVAYGKGRVYNSSMGHLWKGETYPVSYQCIGFQTTLIRATEWLATGKTSSVVPDNFPTQSEMSLSKEL